MAKTETFRFYSADGNDLIAEKEVPLSESPMFEGDEPIWNVYPVIRYDSDIYYFDYELECYIKAEIVTVD